MKEASNKIVVGNNNKTAGGKAGSSARVVTNKTVDNKVVEDSKAIKIVADKTAADKVDNSARVATSKTGSKDRRKTGISRAGNRVSNKITAIKNNKVLNTTSVF